MIMLIVIFIYNVTDITEETYDHRNIGSATDQKTPAVHQRNLVKIRSST